MSAGFLLAFREGLEAALIIGVVLSYLSKVSAGHLYAHVWRGAALAIAVSLAAGFSLASLGVSLEGLAGELFEGITLLIAAGILTYVIFWLGGKNPTAKMSADVEKALAKDNPTALFWLSFFAVVREGVELAVFLLAAQVSSGSQILTGALLGLAAAVFAGWLISTVFRQLNLWLFFQVTNILLILFAAGLVAYGVHEFNEAGVIPPIIDEVWNINHVLNDNSQLGLFLKALFGYNGNPSLSEILAYGAYILSVVFIFRMKTAGQLKRLDKNPS
jgi:high-affinity iron transporter